MTLIVYNELNNCLNYFNSLVQCILEDYYTRTNWNKNLDQQCKSLNDFFVYLTQNNNDLINKNKSLKRNTTSPVLEINSLQVTIQVWKRL